MRSGNRSNALLVELLIVVIFFMLTSTVILEVFTTARRQAVRAEMITFSLAQAQNTADQLYAAEDAALLLESLGFEKSDQMWTLQDEGYRLEAEVSGEPNEAGFFRRQEVRVVTDEGDLLFSLPCSVWKEAAE